MPSITERYADRILGTLSCFDRVVITGTLVDIGHGRAVATTLAVRGFRLFDYTQFAEPLRDEVRATAERLAAESGLESEYVRRKNFRKEERVQAVLRQRGNAPGLVHIFSAMEGCPSFRPWPDKTTQQTSLQRREAQGLHYYFYFSDPDLGLCSLAELLGAAHRRYREFLSALDDPGLGTPAVEKIARPVRENDRPYRGFNLFHGDDLDLFPAVVRGEFAISGLRNRDLQQRLGRSAGQVSRLLKRLRLHGLLKKIGRTYKYYLTHLGQTIIAAALRLRPIVVLPALGGAPCT